MACSLTTNRHGTLAFRLHWNGREWWEGLDLPDTKANRRRVQPIADAISAEIRAGSFAPARYLHYFPFGNRAAEFASSRPLGAPSPAPVAAPTVRAYAAMWLARQRPPFVRPAQHRDYEGHLRRYVLPAWIDDELGRRTIGDLLVTELAPKHLLQLREHLVARPLRLKTARNILDASFRAMMRDARVVDGLITTDPFSALTWPRILPPEPDPFTEAERDRLLEWFRQHRPFYYPFVAVLFLCGLRPSEAVALREGDVDTTTGTIRIARSRYLGSEAAPKTRGSARTIAIVPEVRAILRDRKPLRVDPDAYVFTNAKNGGPINQGEWPQDHWHAALRATGIRPRKFYATRHSFVSIALTRGVNLKFIAEYCGTSVAMIERSYGRFLADGADHQLGLLAGNDCGPQRGRGLPDRTGKTRDLPTKVSGLPRKTQVG